MSTTVALLVTGAVIVVVDLDLDGIPLVPDLVGWVLIGVGGVRLVDQPAPATGRIAARLRTVGWGLAGLAAASAIDWLAIIVQLRPPPAASRGPVVAWDVALLALSVVVVVALFEVLSDWFGTAGLGEARRRLSTSARLVKWTWGTFVIALLVALVMIGPQPIETVHVETWLALPIVLGLFGVLLYGMWAMLTARAELRRAMNAGSEHGQ